MIVNIPAGPVQIIKFDFETEAEKYLPDYVRPLEPARVSGKLIKIEDGFKAEGKISYGFEYDCDLCLKPSKFSKTVEFNEIFKRDYDEDTYHFEGDKIDLTQLVTDAIVLSLPSRLICKPDCKGLCPICGTDRNVQKCGCKVEEAVNNPFDILKGIGGE
ncbi:MAG TPA: YceD family protein [Clostridia bacterium]